MWTIALSVLAGASAAYQLATLVAARRFLGKPAPAPAALPPVSLIVPICGAEPGLGERIARLLAQDYPSFEVLFAALDPHDPGLEVARAAAAARPAARTRVIAGGPTYGPNRKAANLDQAARAAATPLIAHVDSDMWAAPDFLRRLVAPFADPTIGATFALYRGERPRTLGAALEALAISTDFIPQVLLRLAFGDPDFGLGASIALRREHLEKMGGYRAFSKYVNEDYHLVNRARRELGARAAASAAILGSDAGRMRLADYLVHRLRWARTVRAAQPIGYAGTIFTNTTALALLAAAAGAPLARAGLAAALAIRVLVAATLASWIGDGASARLALLAPVNDLIGAAVWVAAHFGRTVLWRGRRYRLRAGGLMEESGPAAPPAAAASSEYLVSAAPERASASRTRGEQRASSSPT
jgi:ceramide glucosyltransferase